MKCLLGICRLKISIVGFVVFCINGRTETTIIAWYVKQWLLIFGGNQIQLQFPHGCKSFVRSELELHSQDISEVISPARVVGQIVLPVKLVCMTTFYLMSKQLDSMNLF